MNKINGLNDEHKDMICDACEENDECELAYTHFFKHIKCQEIMDEIIDELHIVKDELKIKE